MISKDIVIFIMMAWITWCAMTEADKHRDPKKRALHLIPIALCFVLMALTL